MGTVVTYSTSLESASFTLKVIAVDEEENEEVDCGSKWMFGGKENDVPSTWCKFPKLCEVLM